MAKADTAQRRDYTLCDDDLITVAEEIRSLQPGFKIRSWLDTHTMTDAGQKAQLVAALDPLGL